MAILSKGMDPEALQQSAGRFRGYAQEVLEIGDAVRTSTDVIRGNWGGADLQALCARVPAVQQQLGQLHTTLLGLGEHLSANAKAQVLTSASGGSFTPSGGPGGGPNGGPGGGGRGGVAGLLAGLTGGMLFADAKLLKTVLGLPAKLGTLAAWSERLKAISSWDRTANVLTNLKNIWKVDTPLARFAAVLGSAKKWSGLGEASRLLQESGQAGKFAPIARLLGEGSNITKAMGTFGKFLGPAGAVLGGVNAVSELANGQTGRGAYDGVMALATGIACVTPPPVDAVAGVIAGGMAVGELVYDHWDDITSFTGDAAHAVEHVATDAVHGVEHAASSVFHSLNPFD